MRADTREFDLELGGCGGWGPIQAGMVAPHTVAWCHGWVSAALALRLSVSSILTQIRRSLQVRIVPIVGRGGEPLAGPRSGDLVLLHASISPSADWDRQFSGSPSPVG